jgi:hypothetical protein
MSQQSPIADDIFKDAPKHNQLLKNIHQKIKNLTTIEKNQNKEINNVKNIIDKTKQLQELQKILENIIILWKHENNVWIDTKNKQNKTKIKPLFFV